MAESGHTQWERARTDEQKKQRIREIVAATARLYEHLSFEEITFASIAKEAKFTRSNLYKYFNSKEEIFLEFFTQDFAKYREELEHTFKAKRDLAAEEFPQIWVSVLVKNKRLLKLIPILNSFLEKNVSMETLIEFKRNLKVEIGLASALLCEVFPTLTMEKAAEFAILQSATASGLYQMSDLTEMQEKVMELEEFADMRIDFAASLQRAVEHIIRGLIE